MMACTEIILRFRNGARFRTLLSLICLYCQYYAKSHCSTIVESIRQIGLFLQNKANFRKAQMNVNSLMIKD